MTQKVGCCFFTQEREIVVAFGSFPENENQGMQLFWCDLYKYLGRQIPESKGAFWQIWDLSVIFPFWGIWNESVVEKSLLLNAGGSVTKTTPLRAPLLVSISFLIPWQEPRYVCTRAEICHPCARLSPAHQGSKSLPATPSVLQPCRLPRGHGNVLTLGVFSKHDQACRIHIVLPNSAPNVVESEPKGLQRLLFKAGLKYYTSLGFVVEFGFFLFTADPPLPNY